MANQWDETLNRIAKKNADKWGLPTDQAKEIVDCYTSCNMKQMRDNKPVLWLNIGKFYISHLQTMSYLLNRIGLRTFESFFRTRTRDRQEIVDDLNKYRYLRDLARVHDPRNGGYWRYRNMVYNVKKAGGDVKSFQTTKNKFAKY